MKQNFVKYLMALFMLAPVSCEEPIEIDLNESEPRLVIEGKINNLAEQHAVHLSYTTGFFNPALPEKATGATVRVYDDAGYEETLSETTPGTYLTSSFAGIPGRTYTLEVEVDGAFYTAQSTMPEVPVIDSLEQEYFPGNRFADPGYFIHLHFTDTLGIRNYYRFRNAFNGEYNDLIQVFDDRLSDGLPIDYFFFNETYQVNDTAVVELQAIDDKTYLYLLTLMEAAGSDQTGPGTTPANPTSNLSSGALGFFAAYSLASDTLVIVEDRDN